MMRSSPRGLSVRRFIPCVVLLMVGGLFQESSAQGDVADPAPEPIGAIGKAVDGELRPDGPTFTAAAESRFRTGYGLSRSLQVVFTPVAASLSWAWLEPFGTGWSQGHSWRAFAGSDPVGTAPRISFRTDSQNGIVTPETPGAWMLESATGSRLTLVTEVSSRLLQGGYLNGYHIGHYPVTDTDSLGVYSPPDRFIEVTPDNQTLRVSEHLFLGQFITKDQFDVWPKYVALDLRLLDKLELVIQELNAMGIRADRVHVMSGFRTPQYNGPGGDGRAALSRHMWGDAADVWVDNDMNGTIDDLNGDGQIDLYDAAVMMRAVERVERRYPELIGGAGTYPGTSTHGPYIHIDARGFLARW